MIKNYHPAFQIVNSWRSIVISLFFGIEKTGVLALKNEHQLRSMDSNLERTLGVFNPLLDYNLLAPKWGRKKVRQ